MAKIQLRLREARGPLPEVCIVCGEPTRDVMHKVFSWRPDWIILLLFLGLVPMLIAALFTTRTARTEIPVCPAHRGHWIWRNVVALVGLLVVLGGLVAMFLSPPILQLVLFLLVPALLVLWLISVIIMQRTAVRVELIDDYDIHLAGVANGFVDAVANEDEARSERRQRRRLRDHDDHGDHDDDPFRDWNPQRFPGDPDDTYRA